MTDTINNHDDDFVIRIPRAGYEAGILGGAMSIDLNSGGNDTILTDAVEGAGGGLLTYTLYQVALTSIRTEGYVRKGEMTRRQQFQQVRDTAWSACKDGAIFSVVIASVLALCPWLMPFASIAAIFGGAVAGTRLINAAMDAFTPEMKQELKTAAKEAGVAIKGITDAEPEVSTATA